MRNALVAACVAVLLAVMPARADGPPVFLHKWGTTGSGPGQFNQPYGVAVDAGGNVYVSDRGNNRVQKFTSNGGFLLQWSVPSPLGIVVDGAGDVYVAARGAYQVQKFTSEGSFILAWGSHGNGNGQFEQLWGITVDDAGNVYVGDSQLCRVQAFTGTGQYLLQFGSYSYNGQPGTFGLLGGLAHKDGLIYACNVISGGGAPPATAGVERFTTSGGYVDYWSINGPLFIAHDALGAMYLAANYATTHLYERLPNGTVSVLSAPGNGDGDGQFWYATGVAVDAQFNLYVADFYQNRIQKFGNATLSVADPGGIEFALRQNAPNPFAMQTTFSFTVPREATATLAIHDVAGRTIRTLIGGVTNAGSRIVVWDGRDERGHPVPNGIYLAMLRSEGRVDVRRVCVMR